MVSVIIPAHNEGGRVHKAVRLIITHPLVTEVIVVDDGSDDDTAREAREAGARVLSLSFNSGKAQALDRGIRSAKHSVLLLCDGDMYGFTHNDITTLLTPVLQGTCIMTIGVQKKWTSRSPLPRLSGNRVITRKLWNKIPDTHKKGFQIETVLNFYARKIGAVEWFVIPGLSHTVKESKYGFIQGVLGRLAMFREIIWVLFHLYVVENMKFARSRLLSLISPRDV